MSLANQPQRRTGNIGNTQGANTDNTPAKKAKNRIIFVYSKNKAYSKRVMIFSYSPDSSLEIRLRSWSIRMKVWRFLTQYFVLSSCAWSKSTMSSVDQEGIHLARRSSFKSLQFAHRAASNKNPTLSPL